MKKRTLAPGIPMPPFQQPGEATAHQDIIRDQVSPPSGTAPVISGVSRVNRNLQMIDVGAIDPNPLAPREVYTPEMILERAESLRERQNDPIHVIPNPDKLGRYIIADGWTRVLACVEHKARPELLAEIHYDLSIKEAAWLGFEQNESREQHCDLDRAMFFEKMISEGFAPNEVAVKAGLTKQMLSLYRAFRRLPEEVLEVVKMHPRKFGAWSASELAKVVEKAGSRKAVSLAIQFAEEDRTMRWLVSQAQAILDPSPSRGGNLVRQIRYGNGYYKQRGDKFEVSIKVPDERIQGFAEKLESLIETVAIPVGPNLPSRDSPTASSDQEAGNVPT